MEDADEVYQILRDTKVLARRYYQLTRKPLGVTHRVDPVKRDDMGGRFFCGRPRCL